MTSKSSFRRAVSLVCVAIAATAAGPLTFGVAVAQPAQSSTTGADADAGARALQVLLARVDYWRAHNNAEQAQIALDRALRLAPADQVALAIASQRHAPAPVAALPVRTQVDQSTVRSTATATAVPEPTPPTEQPPAPNKTTIEPAARAGVAKMTPAVGQALLRREPANLLARRAAVEGAIGRADWEYAEAAAQDGLHIVPNDPRAWVIAAEVHHARGDDRRAMAELRTAQDLRQQQLGTDHPATPPDDVAIFQVVNIEPSVAPVSVNPFRPNPGAAATPSANETLAAASTVVAPDPISAQIDSQIAALQNQMAPTFMGGVGMRLRTGTTGLSKLGELTVPLEATFSPGMGQLAFRATPTFLTSGQPSSANLQQFGSGIFNNGIQPSNQHAAGVGVDLEYALNWFKADIGASPLGFQQANAIGGIELSPALTNNLRLRIVGERRPVTDSVLSYAGTKDPTTGITWGGVTRTRGHAQLELSAGLANFYLGGGYAALNGYNVASNQEADAGAGVSYPVWRNATDELRLGLDLTYFAYNKNLDFFTLGQGGYFSPQSFFAAIVPLTYSERLDNLTWLIGGSAGYQTFSQHASPIFPNNPYLQSNLEALAAANPGIATSYGSQNTSGIAGGARGEFEYNINTSLRLGGRASFLHAGNWSETQALLYLRYILNSGIR